MTAAGKVVDRERLAAELVAARAAGRTVAFANGVFDLLHVGHLSYLEAAAREADVLVVGVNSDRSVQALKGPGRPLVPAAERARLVAGFACVDWVVLFDETDAEAVLTDVRPDAHCKGTDYTVEDVPEAGLAERCGWRIVIVGEAMPHATSALVDRIRRKTKG